MDYETKERTYAIVRGVIGALAMILGAFGMTVDVEAWAQVAMEIGCVAITLYAWFWKDNNITAERINKEKAMDALTVQNYSPEEVE